MLASRFVEASVYRKASAAADGGTAEPGEKISARKSHREGNEDQMEKKHNGSRRKEPT